MDSFHTPEWLKKALNAARKLPWNANLLLKVPQYVAAVAQKTSQNQMLINVVNLSKIHQASFYLLGTGVAKVVCLKPNAPPWRFQHNFQGGKLQLMNISKNAVTLQVLRVDLSKKIGPNDSTTLKA